MPSRKQHRRDGKYPGHPLLAQRLQAIPQDRAGKFQIAMLHRHRCQLWPQGFHHLGEFLHGQPVATAMAADQDAELVVRGFGQGGVPLFGVN